MHLPHCLGTTSPLPTEEGVGRLIHTCEAAFYTLSTLGALKDMCSTMFLLKAMSSKAFELFIFFAGGG